MTGSDYLPCPLRILADRQPAGIFLSTPRGDIPFRDMEARVRNQEADPDSGCSISCPPPGLDPVDLLARVLAGFRRGVPVLLQHSRFPPEQLREQVQFVTHGLRNRIPSPAPPAFTWSPSAPATLLFTSGSTGNPRAVVHSAGNHWSSASAANRQAPLTPGDRWLCPLPLYHVGGLAIVFRCLEAGATVCFPSPGASVADAVTQCRPTHLSLVPTQLSRWMASPEFSGEGIKRILVGGAPLADSLRSRAADMRLPLAASYGMTETASQVTATPPGQPAVGSGSALDHAEIRISGEGEILVKGASVAMGEVSAQGIRPLTDADGWLHTRDTGRMEKGILFVEGRCDLQFISGGENIQPEQIERALQSLEGVSQAVVVPVADPEFGHRPFAWIDRKVSPSLAEGYREQLRDTLPGYMLPVGFATLPNLGSLKPDRSGLRKQAEDLAGRS